MIPLKVNSDELSSLKKMFRILAYLAMFCAISGATGGAAARCGERGESKNPERKGVLVLLPSNLGFAGQMSFIQALSEELDVPETVELYSESVDLAQLKDPASAQALEEMYQTKFRNMRLDLVIAGQQPVLDFLVNRRKRLFVGMPVVFGMIPKDVFERVEKSPGVTGSVEVLEFAGTVELALALQLGTKRVILVSGDSARDKWLERIAREQFLRLAGKVDFAFWEGLAPSEAKEHFRDLTPNDVIFYLSESEDHAGHVYSREQYLDRIAPDSPVPIYSSLAESIGHGVVGGNLYDSAKEARIVGEQAQQILNGKSPAEIPIADVSMSSVVDWRQLDRWRIPVSRVPVGTELRFAEPTLWEKHKPGIVAVLTFIGLQTALICLLWIEIRRKNKARQMVERQFATERVVMDSSEKFTRCAPEEVEGQIQEGLAALRKAKEMEWALWVTLDPVNGEVAKSFVSWDESVGTDAVIRLGKHTPWLMEEIKAEKSVIISRMERVPDRAEADRKYLEEAGVESLLLIPSNSNGDLRSALLLASREPGREWSRATVGRLRTLGNLFGTALRRRRAEVELKDKKEWLKMALEASKTALWELDVLTGQVRWSQKDDSMVGKAPLELELPWEKFLERVPAEDREDLYRRTLATLEDRSGEGTFVTEWRDHEEGGGERWVVFRGKVYRDAEGRPLRLRGVNVDITELKRTKTELVQLTERLIKAQEDERQRLARELHDDVGQRLSLLIIGLDRLRHGLPAGLRIPREELSASLEEANQLATDIHGLSHQLHSSKLKLLGLKAALNELCAQVSRQHGVDVKLQVDPIPGGLSEKRALCLYRVAQEALNNAVKHSGSTTIEVQLEVVQNMMHLKVKDFGTGFDLSHYSAGVGLASMRERIRMAGGKL